MKTAMRTMIRKVYLLLSLCFVPVLLVAADTVPAQEQSVSPRETRETYGTDVKKDLDDQAVREKIIKPALTVNLDTVFAKGDKLSYGGYEVRRYYEREFSRATLMKRGQVLFRFDEGDRRNGQPSLDYSHLGGAVPNSLL